MNDIRTEGRKRCATADDAMQAGRAAGEMRQVMAKAKGKKGKADLEWVLKNAFACQGLWPTHAAGFQQIVSDVNALLNPQADTLGKVSEGVEYLVGERKARKKQRSELAKKTHSPRGTGKDEEGADIDYYDVCRSMDKHIKKDGITQRLAATRVIDSYNAEVVRIAVTWQTLCRYYRKWKKRNRKRTAD